MNKFRLLSTAAALLLIAGAASAQDLKKNETPAPAPAAQQKAPAEKVAPNMHAGDRKLPETTGQSPKSAEPAKEQSMDKGAMDKGAMDKGAMDKTESTNKKSEAPSAQTKSSDSAQMKANEKASTAQKNDSAKSNESAAAKSNATTGQGAGGAAKLSTEQRTKITSVIKEQHVQSVHLNVSVSVGTRVPESVHFYPVPVEVVNIYPEWRGYDYILADDTIVIIDPHTHEIVAIIEA